MAGGGHGTEQQFTGIQKIFNTYTMRGRINCAYASIAFWTTLFLAIKFRPKSNKPKEIKS